jgi:hypothetical protein
VIKAFVLGAVAGAAAMYFYGREIGEYLDETTREVRTRASDTLLNVAETIEGGLKQAEERVDQAKETIRSRTA